MVKSLDGTVTSRGNNAGGDVTVGGGRSDVLAFEVGEEVGVGLVEGARASESVDFTDTAKVGRADLIRRSAGRGEGLTLNRVLSNNRDVLENITLSKNVTALTDLECVAGVVVPVVVNLDIISTSPIGPSKQVSGTSENRETYSVENSVSLDLGATATGVVDVVALQGNQVAGTVEVDSPVVVAVAGGGPVGLAVDEGVRDGDALVGFGAEDDVLPTDAGGLFSLVKEDCAGLKKPLKQGDEEGDVR